MFKIVDKEWNKSYGSSKRKKAQRFNNNLNLDKFTNKIKFFNTTLEDIKDIINDYYSQCIQMCAFPDECIDTRIGNSFINHRMCEFCGAIKNLDCYCSLCGAGTHIKCLKDKKQKIKEWTCDYCILQKAKSKLN